MDQITPSLAFTFVQPALSDFQWTILSPLTMLLVINYLCDVHASRIVLQWLLVEDSIYEIVEFLLLNTISFEALQICHVAI